MINKLLLAGLIWFMSPYAFAQIQKGRIINNSYHDLTVKHSTQLASGKETVFSKVTNTQYATAISVVYTINFRGGGTRTLVITVQPGAMHNENLGEVGTFSVSVVKLIDNKQADRSWIVNNSIIVEFIRLEGGILISSLTGLQKVKESLSPSLSNSEMNDEETREILKIFFDKTEVQSLVINHEDKIFAKKLLIELLEGSCQMSIPEAINPYAVFNTSIRKLVVGILTSYLKKCPETVKDKYYIAVRNTVKLKHKEVFSIRIQTGEW